MKKIIWITAIMIALASCTPPAPEANAAVMPPVANTPIPTETPIPTPIPMVIITQVVRSPKNEGITISQPYGGLRKAEEKFKEKIYVVPETGEYWEKLVPGDVRSFTFQDPGSDYKVTITIIWNGENYSVDLEEWKKGEYTAKTFSSSDLTDQFIFQSRDGHFIRMGINIGSDFYLGIVPK